MDCFPDKKITLRILLCLLILVAGFLGWQGLKMLKKPPTTAPPRERALQVEIMTLQPEDVDITIAGYGEALPLDVVTISPEVSGRIEAIHPLLENGEVIAAGEVLFAIDPRDYEAALLEARATVDKWRTTIDRLKKQDEIDKKRLAVLERNAELARADYDRVRTLLAEKNIGAQSAVEAKEQLANTASDTAARLAQTIALYPLQIREAENSLEAAGANLKLARTRLDRCRVRAPFPARIKEVTLEKDQYVVPGQQVLTIADDSRLEIEVPIDSQDARKWLRFTDGGETSFTSAWFTAVAQVPCRIRWTEDPVHAWTGTLDRVVRFSQETRTLTVAVAVTAAEAQATDSGALPLVEGMFCEVLIPGKRVTGLYKIPRWSVSPEDTVYLARGNRLVTTPVTVTRIEGETALVGEGLSPGDRLIVTRLVNPLENSLLNIVSENR